MSDPDVLLLIDGKVGVEIDHLWRSVRRSGVPCYLHKNIFKNDLTSMQISSLNHMFVNLCKISFSRLDRTEKAMCSVQEVHKMSTLLTSP